jgi:hypothetical protein
MSQLSNSKSTVLFASLAGTTIEFFDFYINSLLLGNYFGLGGFIDFPVGCFPL